MGSGFGHSGKGFVRFNIACPKETLEKSVKLLIQGLKIAYFEKLGSKYLVSFFRKLNIALVYYSLESEIVFIFRLHKFKGVGITDVFRAS